VDGDDVSMFDAQVMSHDTVDTSASIIEIVIREHDQDGVSPLLALDQNRIAPEELQGLHGVVRESNDGVVIVDGISHTVRSCQRRPSRATGRSEYLHQRVGLLLLLEDGCRGVELLQRNVSTARPGGVSDEGKRTSFFSAPEGSLNRAVSMMPHTAKA